MLALLLKSAVVVSISITMDIYSHVLPSIQLEAMDKLDDLFRERE
jgi:hypothetical protein